MEEKRLSPLASNFLWIAACGISLAVMKAAGDAIGDYPLFFFASLLGACVAFCAALGSLFSRSLIGAALGVILFILLLAGLPILLYFLLLVSRPGVTL